MSLSFKLCVAKSLMFFEDNEAVFRLILINPLTPTGPSRAEWAQQKQHDRPVGLQGLISKIFIDQSEIILLVM